MLQEWGLYYGLYIWEIRIIDTVRVRRHKKKRIDKKWRKRYGFKRVEQKNKCYLMRDRYGRECLCCTADIIEILRKTFEEKKAVHAINDYITLRGKAEPLTVKESPFEEMKVMIFPKKRGRRFVGNWNMYKMDAPVITSGLDVIYQVKDE